jgi:pimeloyl-ACP methyl ester carboxylesterase
MSPARRHPLIGIGAALAAAAAGVAAGVVADRASKQRAAEAALETGDSLEIIPDEQHVVLTDDGVPLHVEIDVPTPEAAAEAAADTTEGDDPRLLPTVVMSHGYCLSMRSWIFQRRALKAAGYRVVSWDQRGHGQSGKGDAESYVIDRLGRDLHAVITEHAPTGDLVLIGHSMGGMTVLALGEHYPALVAERVIGVGFIATSPGGLTLANGGRMAITARLLLERVGPRLLGPLSERPELVLRMRRAGRDLEDFLVDQNSFASPVPRSVVRYTADMLLSTPLDVINDYLKTFDGFDKRPALSEFLHSIVLVFNGRQDILTPPAHSELIVEGIPGAEHLVVNDAGHLIMLEHPDLLNAHLIQLIDQAARARAERIDVSRQPHVRRVVTDVAKERRIRGSLKSIKAPKKRTAKNAEKVEKVERIEGRERSKPRRRRGA